MTKLYSRSFRSSLWILALLLVGTAIPSYSQLYQPEGLHMPGLWNGYTNLPNAATTPSIRGTNTLNCGTGTNVCTTGGINRVGSAASSSGTYRTTIHAAAAGDFAAGSYPFVFSSGPGSGGQFNNTWKGVNVIANTLQNYSYQSGSDANVTLVNNTWYTVNWVDNGYGATQGIFMATSAAPISITNVTQLPIAGSVTPSNSVAVTATLSAAKSAEELVYVRFSLDNFTTSTIVAATGSGTSYSATIPAQANGATVQYYAFTSTMPQLTLAAATRPALDAYAITYKIDGGGLYTYTSTSLPPVNIQFRVDMANQTVSGGGVFIAGTFNGFSTSANQLTQEGATSIYSATIPLAQNTSINYKFVNGSFEDNIAAPCGNGSDRTFSIGTANATVTLSCYSKCGVCPPLRPVTFQVDLQNEAAVTAMYVSGEFNGYNVTANPLVNSSGTTWTATLNLEEGRSYSYKFVRNVGDYENNIPSGACNPGGAGGGNRNYTVTTAPAQTIPVACFSTCGACAVLSTVTLSVDMRDQNVTGGVSVSGNFNSFNTNAAPMNRIGTSSVYTRTLTIAEGFVMSYKFVNGVGTNNYEGNLGAPCGAGNNRTYTVPNTNTTIATACFSSCSACLPKRDVSFKVNMAGQTVVGPVSLVGDFNGFNPATNPMTQIGATGVYQIVVSITEGAHIYKFWNTGGPNSGYEGNIGLPCGNGSNRTVTVPNTNLALSTVCFNSCIDCGATNTWTGAANTDFANGPNWTAGFAPSGCSANIQINNVVNKPIIGSGTASVGSVGVATGALLTVSSGATLDVCGGITGTGLISGLGTLVASGAAVQNVSMNGGKVVIRDFSLSKSGGSFNVTNGSISVTGNLSLSTTSALSATAPGAVVLASSAAGTGRLAQVPVGASISGLTLERRLPSTTGWYFVSAPFTSASTFTQWSELPGRVAPSNNANILQFTETDSSAVLSGTTRVYTTGWRPAAASLASPFNPSNRVRGYRVFQNAAFISGGGKLAVTGNPLTGDVFGDFTFTPASPGGYDGGGWNLMGNPYPSEIDWNAVKFASANTAAPSGNAINVYNGTTKTYGSWTALTASTGVATNGGSRYIASSQSYFIKATATGSLLFQETQKNNANPNTFVRTADPDNTLRIALAGNSTSDEAVIVFMNGALRGADQFDAAKLANDNGLNLAIVPASSLEHSISVMPMMSSRETMPLSVSVVRAGSYTLAFNGLTSFAAGTRVFVRDAYLGTQTEVVDGANYAFTISSDPASQGGTRFAVVLQPASVTGTATMLSAPQLSVWPVPAAASSTLNVHVARLGSGQGIITMMDVAGRKVATQSAVFSQDGTTSSISLKGLPKGVYTLKVQGSAASATKQVVVE